MSQPRTLSKIVTALVWTLIIYVAAYFWFLYAHTLPSMTSRFPYTQFVTGTSDSFFIVLFYPALCVNSTFDPERWFILTDTGGDILIGKHIYPFAEGVSHSHPAPTPSPTATPDA